MKSLDRRVDELQNELFGKGPEMSANIIRRALEEAMRDQRHACEQVLYKAQNLRGASEPPVIYRHEAQALVLTADVE